MIRTKSISIPRRRRSLLAVIVWSIADGLRWVNRNHNDYDVRALAGELTVAERRAEKREDDANHKKNIDDAVFFNDY